MPVYIPPVNETTAPMQFDGTVIVAGNNITAQMGQLSPSSSGLLAYDFPLWNASTSTNFPATTSILLMSVYLPLGLTVSNAWFFCNAAGTQTVCFAGLYNSTGTQVAVSANFTASLTSTSLNKIPFTSPYSVAAAGQYWVALNLTWSVQPTFYGLNATVTPAILSNGTGAAVMPFALNGTGATLPATITPASNTTTGAVALWTGLS